MICEGRSGIDNGVYAPGQSPKLAVLSSETHVSPSTARLVRLFLIPVGVRACRYFAAWLRRLHS